MTNGWWIAAILFFVVAGQLLLLRRLQRRLNNEQARTASLERTLSFIRKELAEVQTRRKRLLAASTQALVIVEDDYRVSSANKVAKRLFGPLSRDMSIIEWTRQHRLNELVEQTLQNQKPPQVYFPKDDKVLEANAKSIKLKKKVVAVALAIHDVTELQRLTRARRDFVTNISHELRTPLASIRLLTDTLLHGALNDSEMALNLVDKIAAQTEMLSQLAQELMDLSLIESGQAPLRLSPCSLREMVQEQVEYLLPQAERKNVQLKVNIEGDLIVLADKTMLARVITNLVHNAIKFTDTGSVVINACFTCDDELDNLIASRLPADKNNDDWVLVSIADTGIGIPPDEIGRIFERFYKIDRARKRPRAGTGLGLAIAKHIVEAHGGTIWAQNNPEGGATFYFTLPIEIPPEPDDQAGKEQEAAYISPPMDAGPVNQQ
jgi:two-component system, OmpR family, phosphate regulon sensor histidine kinase PhoR